MYFLAAIWDGGGNASAELGVVRRTVDRGHTVTVLADPTLADDVAATGASFRPWTSAPHRSLQASTEDVIRDWEARSPLGMVACVRDRLIAGPAAAFAADVRDALAEKPADAVLACSLLLGAMVAAESAGVPFVALVPNIYTRPAPGLPAFGLGLQPPTTALHRLRDRGLNQLAAQLWKKGLPALNAARADLGLDPLDDIWQQWDRAARVLVLTSAAFDFPAQLPVNVCYTGAMLDDPHWAAPYPVPEGDAPLVVVGLSSTYMRQTDLLRRIVAALDALPVRAVVTTGPAINPTDIPGTAMIHVVRSAPHVQLFSQAAAVITHAGHGTLIKALAAGLPTLCLPMGRDQHDNAARATRHAAALSLKPTAPCAAITHAVQQLLDNPAIRRSAQALGARIRGDANTSRLIDELESLANKQPH
jgi:MGT family glycosyltransferase